MAENNNDFIKEVDLKNGEIFVANGKRYQIKDGAIIELPKEKNSNPEFNLYFSKDSGISIKDFPKNEDFSIKEENKCLVVDIYPLLKRIFNDGSLKLLNSLEGVGYISKDAGDYKISLNRKNFESLNKDLEDIFGIAISNSRQLDSIKSLARKRLNDPFDDFFHILW